MGSAKSGRAQPSKGAASFDAVVRDGLELAPTPGGELTQRCGEKLRTLRIAHELTLQQLAAERGYATHAYISELESGKKIPTAALVLKVARRFGVSTDVLMMDELQLPNA